MTHTLNEARTIWKADDAIELLNNGKLAGRLGGKKFVPQWIRDDTEMFGAMIDATLALIGESTEAAGDEAIQFLIKCSKNGPETWQSVVEQCPDTIIELSKAFASQWFKAPEWQNRLNDLINAEEFNQEDWHKLEKDIQETFAKRAAKKGKKINNTSLLYYTIYDDGHWKLLVPKSFEGDVELASHIKPFMNGSTEYKKTQWCTAAQKSYYDRYTNNNSNRLYVIQYFNKAGEYEEAWQLAFSKADHIEFMNKRDEPKYKVFLDNVPDELLKGIVCDNIDSRLYGMNVSDMVKALKAKQIDPAKKIDSIFSFPIKTIQAVCGLYRQVDNCLLTKDGNLIEMKGLNDVMDVLELPSQAKYFGRLPQILRGRKVKVLVFPEGLKTISEGVLRYVSVAKVVIPSTVTKIAARAFQSSDLHVIEIPDSVKSIDDEAFEGCNHLKTVKLPAKLYNVGKRVFANCKKLQTVENMEAAMIGEEVFAECPSLAKDMTILKNATSIPERFAANNLSLKSFVVPATIEKIGRQAFYGCKELSVVDFSQATNLKEIEMTAFADTGIKEIVLPTSLTKIGREVFADCRNLTSVTFTDSNIKLLPTEAFEGCVNLTTVQLPSSLRAIGSYAFKGTKIASLELPGKLFKLDDSAFCNMRYLTSLKLPSRLSVIPNSCFENCKNLEKVEASTNLHTIARYAFDNCVSLTAIDFYGPDLDEFEPFYDVEYNSDAFSGAPYGKVLEKAGVFEN